MPKQIFIGDAYETFKQIRQDHLEDLQKNPADIDPFKLFFSLKQINSLVSQQDEMTAQITDLVSQLFVSVKLSDVVEKAVEEAHELATTLGKEFSVEIDLKYDPLFVTNFVSLKTKIRDELYNVVKHGGEKARVYCDLTNQIPSYILDFHNRDLQLTEPIPRLIIEDNGAGIADTPMQHMNEYLAGRRNKVTSTSGGGLGTEIMRHFLGIHDTICYCERIEEPGKTGTRYSSYFLKTRA